MALVSGPLSTVTADPTAVSVVQVSVQGPRTVGTGVQTHESKNVVVSGGVFSHEIAPGPATLTMVVGQQPGPPIPILVDDVASQTLAEVVDAARLATGQTQESLAQFVQQVLTARTEVLDAAEGFGQVEEDALTAIGVEVGKAEGAADRAEDAADRAESAANDGLGDGAVTVAKLAPDVKAQINSKADLVGGKVPTSQIPEVALTKPFSVTSRAALLALTAQEGDIGIITAGADKGSYMLGTGPANVFGSWVHLAVSADAPVASVNGQTGTVVLNATDVGAAPTTHTHTMAQITDLPTVAKTNTGDAIVQRWSTGNISVPSTPDAATAASSKAYVDSRTPPPVRQEVQGTNGATIFEKHGNVVHVASTGTEAGVTVPTDFRPTQIRRVAVSTSATGPTGVGICTLNTNGSISGAWAAGSAFSYLIQ